MSYDTGLFNCLSTPHYRPPNEPPPEPPPEKLPLDPSMDADAGAAPRIVALISLNPEPICAPKSRMPPKLAPKWSESAGPRPKPRPVPSPVLARDEPSWVSPIEAYRKFQYTNESVALSSNQSGF